MDFISDSEGAPTRITATPPDELRQTLLEFLAVVVARGLLDLLADHLDATIDVLPATRPADDGGVVLVDDDALGAAQLLRA